MLHFSKKQTKAVQTIIHVYPHFLESNKVTAQVISEKRCQTQITLSPEQDDKNLYSMLEYIPFQDIQADCQRCLNLPRKQRLQFSSSFKLNLSRCLLDDDGVNELWMDLKERSKAKKHVRMFEHASTQTED